MKPGWKTTEFYISIAIAVGTVTASLQGSLPPRWAAICSTASAVAYAVARGIAKIGEPPVVPTVTTTTKTVAPVAVVPPATPAA